MTKCSVYITISVRKYTANTMYKCTFPGERMKSNVVGQVPTWEMYHSVHHGNFVSYTKTGKVKMKMVGITPAPLYKVD